MHTQKASNSFIRAAARLLHVQESDKKLNELAQLAWEISLVRKDKRIKMIQSYIAATQHTSITFGDCVYDTMELLLALHHLRRSAFPSPES